MMARERTYLNRERSNTIREQLFLAKESNLSRNDNVAPGSTKLIRMPTICIGPSLEELHARARAQPCKADRMYERDFPPIDMFSSRMQVRLRLVQTQRENSNVSSTANKQKRKSTSVPNLYRRYVTVQRALRHRFKHTPFTTYCGPGYVYSKSPVLASAFIFLFRLPEDL